MIVGTTIYKMDGTAYLSPDFGRGGLAATFAVDVTQISGTPSVTITVQTRNSEDTTYSDLGSFTAITGSPMSFTRANRRPCRFAKVAGIDRRRQWQAVFCAARCPG